MAESKKQEEGPKKLGTFDPPKEGEAIRSDHHTTRYYHVMKELERGTMGVVLLVKDQTTQKEYAMKCEQRVDNKEDRSRRLKLEILAMLGFRASRPKHLLQAIEYGVHKDLVFTVMPLIWKTLADLEKYMDGEVFSKSTAIQIAMQSLQGVAAMHQRGLLHGDIKPANIAVGRQLTTVYLLDYGLYRFGRQDDGCQMHHRGRTASGGTVIYSSIGGLYGEDQTRADDVESWFYVMFPYISMKKGADYLEMPMEEEIKKEILRTKEADKTKEILDEFSLEEVIKAQNSLVVQKKMDLLQKGPKAGWDLPLAVNIIREYIIGLTWYDRPDYEYILQLLKDTDTVEKWCDLEEPLDWLKPGIAAKIAKEGGGKKKDDKSLRVQ